jgi:hypothetical protein
MKSGSGEIYLRCCSFLTHINFESLSNKNKTTNSQNQIAKFLVGDNINTNSSSYSYNRVYPINISDFIKNLKLILKNLRGNEDYFDIINEIIKDMSFSNEIYRKFEEMFNIFFDDQ